MDISIAQQTDLARYVIVVDGTEAGFCAYVDGAERDFNHTEIYPEYRGKGLSGKLIAHALDDSRADGRPVIASCSAVAAFIERNPEYADLLSQA